MTVYAVIETGGKQYKVSYNDIIKIEKIPGNVGEVVEFKKIHLLNADDDLKFDEKELSEASVKGKIISQEKDKKIIVFKFKRRKNYKKKQGHRQQITRVLIKEIFLGNELLTLKDEKKKVSKKVEEKPVEVIATDEVKPEKPAEKTTRGKKKPTGKVEKKPAAKKAAKKEKLKSTPVKEPKTEKKTTKKTGEKKAVKKVAKEKPVSPPDEKPEEKSAEANAEKKETSAKPKKELTNDSTLEKQKDKKEE